MSQFDKLCVVKYFRAGLRAGFGRKYELGMKASFGIVELSWC